MKIYSYNTNITFMPGGKDSPHHLATSGEPRTVSEIFGGVTPPGMDADEKWYVLLNAGGHCADVLHNLDEGRWEVPGIGDVLVVGKEVTVTYGHIRTIYNIYLRIRQEPRWEGEV